MTAVRTDTDDAAGERHKLMVNALAFLVATQTADYLTFLLMVDAHGLGAERNPIVVAMASHGLGVLTAAKVAGGHPRG
jgi:hypothetical protein